MQKLSQEEVKKIAKLARLELSDQEVEKFSPQLSSILEYVDLLQEVNIDNIEAEFQVEGLKDVTRDDVVSNSEIEDVLINCAPEKEGRLVKVKNVL